MVEAAVAEFTVAEVTVGEIAVMESAVTEVPAVRFPGVMVIECSATVPVVPPVAPAPAKSSEEADTKPNAKGKADAAPKNPGLRIPARVSNDRPPIHEPRIVSRDVDHLGVGWFDDDRFT